MDNFVIFMCNILSSAIPEVAEQSVVIGAGVGGGLFAIVVVGVLVVVVALVIFMRRRDTNDL